ncbi:MAG: OsmC family protein [Chthonomonas sp.]|nr:OsmC family protein [Chthonomonas sp.]
MAHLHEYPVRVEWTGGREGGGTVTAERSSSSQALSVPPEFQGPGAGTNPEELLASAIASCYTITLGIITANQKVPVMNVVTQAVGTVEQSGMQFNYKSVVIRPTITLAADADDAAEAKAHDLAHKADGYCIITNAVRGKVEITVEPTVLRG